METSTKIGGENSVVEIVQSAFGSKYNTTKTRWIIGGFDRKTKKCFLSDEIFLRDEKALTKVIEKNVEPGTTIVTKDWQEKNKVSICNFDLTHCKVKFAEENVKLDDYLPEYMWRSLHTSNYDLLQDFAKAVQYFYPL